MKMMMMMRNQHEAGDSQGCKAVACFMLVSCFAYSSTLKMERYVLPKRR
jgi:hypothetical protein